MFFLPFCLSACCSPHRGPSYPAVGMPSTPLIQVSVLAPRPQRALPSATWLCGTPASLSLPQSIYHCLATCCGALSLLANSCGIVTPGRHGLLFPALSPVPSTSGMWKSFSKYLLNDCVKEVLGRAS